MVGSDRTRASSERSARRHRFSFGADTSSPENGQWHVEAVLRTVVAGFGVALLVTGCWRLLAGVGIGPIIAVLDSAITPWLLVVVLGCLLLAAALRSRPSTGE